MADGGHPFETGLDRGPANFAPLTPVGFLDRAAAAFAARTAVIHGERRFTYRDLDGRCRRLASALRGMGVGRLDTVAVLAPNVPALIEAHFAVPILGAVLNPLNTRLDPATIALSLDHGGAKVLIADREYAPLVREALGAMERPPRLVAIDDPECAGGGTLDAPDYEALLAGGDPAFEGPGPDDEWQSLCLLYTSGTTGAPKGVVYSHRGAYLASLSNLITFQVGPEGVYLWTLPMFHCNGWTFPWAMVAVGGTQVCLRRVDPGPIFQSIRRHGVTHLCGAPIVMNMLANAPIEARVAFERPVRCATGGAAPPSSVLRAMEAMGFTVTHLYGATESYGPSTACVPRPEWRDLDAERRFANMARQGIPNPAVGAMMVADPVTLAPVPQDGTTVGELMLRGNTVMKGYLKNAPATEAAFAGGWLRSGDLAVWHGDGEVEIKDRLKDIIISGGENIASLEVEEVLYRHPAVLEAAVVARPDPAWGESACAFVDLKPAAKTDAAEIVAFCRKHLARFKVPRTVVFGPLPKTSTGKIQKFSLRERARGLED